MSRIWKAGSREGYCKHCRFVVAVGWRTGTIKRHAQFMARLYSENGINRTSSKPGRDIKWCPGGDRPPWPMPTNPLDPYDPREGRQ